MITRILKSKCISLAKQYPIVTITGPRQSGKTTLARSCFPKKAYVNLEEPDKRKIALEDPRGFLSNFPQGAILDKIQRTPDIPSYIQSIVDSSKQRGMFILTGSQQFEISQTISQSLAGRTALVKLLPFSLEEINRYKRKYTLNNLILKGFYPRLHDEKLEPLQFFMNYFETYVQRDLRQLSNIENLNLFEKFVRLLASRIGQLLNYTNLSNDIGVSQPTIRKWISLLEASFIVYLLPPFYRNIGKRLIKTPKLYFYDNGLAAYLLEIENSKHLQSHPLRGLLFENFIVMEFLKRRLNQTKPSNLFFYRDRTGHEVDLILSSASQLTAIEIKSSQTINTDFSKDILFFKDLFKKDTQQSYVVYTGMDIHNFKGVKYIPWTQLKKIQ